MGSSQTTFGHKAPVSDTAACAFQEAASCSHSSIATQRKAASKAPFHPPPLHAASQSAPPEPSPSQLSPSSQLNCEVKEVKSILSQTEERASSKQSDEYPKEFDALGKKEPENWQSTLSSENASNLNKETPAKDVEVRDGECKNKNLDQAEENNNFTKNGDANISKNDSRDDDRGTTVPLKTPLVLNEPALRKAKYHVHFARKKLKRAKGKESSKPKEGHHSGICSSGVRISVNGGGLRAGTVMLKTQHIQDNAVLKRAKSYVPVDFEESLKQEEGDDGHRSTSRQAPSLSEGLSNGETRSIPSVDASPFKKEAPFNQEESALDTIDLGDSTPGELAGSRTVVHSAIPEEGIVVKGVESSNPIQKNRHESKVIMCIRYL